MQRCGVAILLYPANAISTSTPTPPSAKLGCATQVIWDNPNASQQQFNQDNYSFTQAAQQYLAPVFTPQPQGQMVSGYYVALSWSQQLGAALNNSAGGYSTNQNLFNSPMQSKGYYPRKQTICLIKPQVLFFGSLIDPVTEVFFRFTLLSKKTF